MRISERQVETRLPFGLAQQVEVTFAAADSDTVVRHTLPAGRYRDVHYFPLRLAAATIVYTGTKAPEPGVLYLRATVATTVTLLLVLPRDANA